MELFQNQKNFFEFFLHFRNVYKIWNSLKKNLALGGDFFLNAVNWLTLEEDLIAIRPIDPSERSLRMMTPSEVAFVQMAAIFLIPLIIFLIGVGVWWRRR